MTTSSAPLPAAPATTPAPAAKPVKAATAAPKTAPRATAKAPAKVPAQAPAKSAAKPQPAASKQPAAKAAKPAKPAKPAKAATADNAKDSKAKKPKLVRDSFTIPKDEYAVIETLKQRSAALAQPVKKSELLRAGLKVLAALSDSALRSAVQAVPSIKTGRPKAEAPAAKAAPASAPSPAPATAAKPAAKTAKASRK